MLITHMYMHNKNNHSRVISYRKTSCPLSVMSSLGPCNDDCKFFKQESITLQKLQALLQSVGSTSNISLATTGISNLSLTYILRTYVRTSHSSVIIIIPLNLILLHTYIFQAQTNAKSNHAIVRTRTSTFHNLGNLCTIEIRMHYDGDL